MTYYILKAFSVIGQLIINAFNFLYQVLGKFWVLILSFALVIIMMIREVVVFAAGIVVKLVALMSSMIFNLRGDFSSDFSEYLYPLQLLNTVLPLEEAFVMASSLSILYLVMLLYRFIKSWLPLVGN